MISNLLDNMYVSIGVEILVRGVQIVLAYSALKYSLSKEFWKKLRQLMRSRKYLNQSVTHSYYNKDEKSFRVLRRHLEVAWNNELLQNPKIFISLSAAAFLLSFIFFNRSLNMSKKTIVYSVFMGTMPFFITWIRVNSKQIKGSYEGETVYTRLKNVFQTNGNNMRMAIKKMPSELEDCPISKRAFFQLAYKLDRIQVDEDMDIALDDFAFSTNTKWAESLARKIKASILDRLDVSEALSIDLVHLNHSKKSLEYFKKINFENLMLIVFSPVLMMASALFLMFNPYRPMGVVKYMDIQFRSASGLQSFMQLVVLWVINYITVLFFRRKKMDLFKG